MALLFYASGTYQRIIGGEAFACMSQSMVSRSIAEISRIISDHLMNRFVFFPENQDQKEAKKDWYKCLIGSPFCLI